MQEQVEFWNHLHRGHIERIQVSGSAAISLQVRIPFLRPHLAAPDDHLWVVLHDAHGLRFTSWEAQHPIIDFTAIASLDLEILSGVGKPGGALIACNKGLLEVEYERAEFAFNSGDPRPLSHGRLAEAAERFWRVMEGRRAPLLRVAS